MFIILWSKVKLQFKKCYPFFNESLKTIDLNSSLHMHCLILKHSNDSRLLLLVRQGKEVVNQAHAKHRDARLLHQHRTGPQKQTEQQEEGRSCGRETLPNITLGHTPEKQG